MKTLLIKLNAPLQSFGDEAYFGRRTTALHPSKSAIIGMLAAALGYERDDARILALNQLDFAVRVDQPGTIMTDFQVISYKAGKKLSWRYYIQDAVFIVAVGSNDGALIDQLQFALHHPKFQLFIGRLANAPTSDFILTVQDNVSVMTALQELPWQAADWYQRKQRTLYADIIADADLINGGVAWMVRDRVVSFSTRRREHGFRSVKSLKVTLQISGEVATKQHNVFDVI